MAKGASPVTDWAYAHETAVVDDDSDLSPTNSTLAPDSFLSAHSSYSSSSIPASSLSPPINTSNHPFREPRASAFNKARFRSKSHSIVSKRRPQSFFGPPPSVFPSPADVDSLRRDMRHLSLQPSDAFPPQNRRRPSHGPDGGPGCMSGTNEHSNNNTNGGIKGLIRRASMSLKGFVHPSKRHSVTQLPSSSTAVDAPDHLTPPRPSTSYPTWHRRLRQAASFRQTRTSHGAADAQLPHRFEEHPYPFVPMPLPGRGSEPPIIPEHTGAGAKAAVAAAAAAAAAVGGGLNEAWRSSDGESGIGIGITVSTTPDSGVGIPHLKQDTNISRVDFVADLPVELSIQILAYLDAASLAAASLVSRRWDDVVRNRHVWRDAFLRAKTGTYATGRPVQPGSGQGVPAVAPHVDWKKVYHVKQQLDRSWRKGKAKPVYLNGHLDSIYCLQFDE